MRPWNRNGFKGSPCECLWLVYERDPAHLSHPASYCRISDLYEDVWTQDKQLCLYCNRVCFWLLGQIVNKKLLTGWGAAAWIHWAFCLFREKQESKEQNLFKPKTFNRVCLSPGFTVFRSLCLWADLSRKREWQHQHSPAGWTDPAQCGWPLTSDRCAGCRRISGFIYQLTWTEPGPET